jgi:hypothetical protein
MTNIKEFLDKHPNMIISFEAEPEGIDQDTGEYLVWAKLKDSDDVTAVNIRGKIFDNLDENLNALFSAASAVFGFTD